MVMVLKLEALDNLCYVQDSFGTDIITREPDVEEVAVAIPLESGAEYGLGQLANPLFDSISPFSRSLFGSALQTLDIARWPTINDFVKTIIGSTHLVSTSPRPLIFIAVPCVDKTPSLVNLQRNS